MPVIAAIPSPTVVRRWRGVLDFYCYRGLACVRKWPRPPTKPRSAAVLASAAIFADFGRRSLSVDSTLYSQTLLDTEGTTWTWRDELTSAAYGHLVKW